MRAIRKQVVSVCPRYAATAALVLAELVTRQIAASPHHDRFDVWSMGGHDLANSRTNWFEHDLCPANVTSLAVKWSITTSGDVSATPAVVHGAVYFPDWGGTFWKLDASTGAVLWSRSVPDYVGIPGAVSRSSPAVMGDTVYIGTQMGAYLLAIDAATGDLRWRTQLDSHPYAILTQSPVVYGGIVYQGVSSSEEVAAIDSSYPCCSFRGSLAAVSAASGRVLWQTHMIPDQGDANQGDPNQGDGTDTFSGAAVWGGTPAIDPFTNTVYITTGNNYEVPQSVEDCQTNGGTARECLPTWNRVNSIVALDLWTGAIKWSTGQDRFDIWNGGCIVGPPPNNCPNVAGPDWDFGEGAHLFLLRGPNHSLRRAVGAGQKSGEYWMLDADTGEVIWSAVLGPGSFLGGVEWGTATDGSRIYFAESDFLQLPYELPNGETITAGSFGALEPNSGQIVWQTAEPYGGFPIGAVSTANGVTYAGSLNGHMYALDSAKGDVLWDYQGPGSSAAGPAIAGGTVYWGNGYARAGTPSTTFYAFSASSP